MLAHFNIATGAGLISEPKSARDWAGGSRKAPASEGFDQKGARSAVRACGVCAHAECARMRSVHACGVCTHAECAIRGVRASEACARAKCALGSVRACGEWNVRRCRTGAHHHLTRERLRRAMESCYARRL